MRMLDEIINALGEEERVILATIIAARGSSPASVSSKLLLRSGGTQSVGTIGGGCMEGDVVVRARQMYAGAKDEIMTCGLDEDGDNGLICGGRVDILLERLTPADRRLFLDLRALDDRGEDCVVATLLGADGNVAGRAITQTGDLSAPIAWQRPDELTFLAGGVPPGLGESVATVLRKGEPLRVDAGGGALILEPWYATPRLFIFGGGHVGRSLCRAAAAAGFRVTVADDREKFANPARFPEAAATLVLDFADAVRSSGAGVGSYLAIVTRGHAFDETVLEQALRSDARYIGMIGSKKKVLTAMRHLYARGLSLERLRAVHAPIGIEIGAVTAEEIAVSVVAQLIRVRRGGPAAAYDKSDDMRIMLHDLGPQPLIANT